MCTIQPDLADYLLNYQGNNCNKVINTKVKSSSVRSESSVNDITKGNSTDDTDMLSKRQKKAGSNKFNKTKMIKSVTNKRRQNNNIEPEPKRRKVCETMADKNNSTNNFFCNESILELLKYQGSNSSNTTDKEKGTICKDSSRNMEMEQCSFDSGVHLNDEWNKTCLIPANEDGMTNSDSDGDSDDSSDYQSFTDDQLALIETVMSHDSTILGSHSSDRIQNDVSAAVSISLNSTHIPEDNNISYEDCSQNNTIVSSDSADNCISRNSILMNQTECHDMSSEEMIPDKPQDKETHNCPAALQPEIQQEIAMASLYGNTEEVISNSDTEINSHSLRDGEQHCIISFSKLQSEPVECTKTPKDIELSSKAIHIDSDSFSKEIEYQSNSLPSETVQTDKADDIVDSDCEIRSIQSFDSDLFVRNEVISSTPIYSASINNTVDNALYESQLGLNVHQCPQKEKSKHAIDYLMQMNEDEVDNAIDGMLSSHQFHRFDVFSTPLFPYELSTPPNNENFEKQSKSSEQEDTFDDVMLETEVCEVTVDNNVTNPLEEDVPFLPPGRKPTETGTQEKFTSITSKTSTNRPQVMQNNIKNKCNSKTPKIKMNKSLKPKKDRVETQSKPNEKKCASMTELKKQHLLSKYISNDKQMQLVIPFLPIKSKKKKNFKVLPRNTTVLNSMINRSSSVQNTSNSVKDTADINQSEKFSSTVTSNTQKNVTTERTRPEDFTDTENRCDKVSTKDTNVEKEMKLNANDQPKNDQINQNSDYSSINCDHSPASDMKSDENCQLLNSNNVDILGTCISSAKSQKQEAHPISFNSEKDQLRCYIDMNQNNKLNNDSDDLRMADRVHGNDMELMALHSNDHCAVSIEMSGASQNGGCTVAKTSIAVQVENVSRQASPNNIEASKESNNEIMHSAYQEGNIIPLKEHSEDNNHAQTWDNCMAGSCQHALVGGSKDTPLQEKELYQEEGTEFSPKEITNRLAMSSDTYEDCKGESLLEEELIQEKHMEITTTSDNEMDTADINGDILETVCNFENNLCAEKNCPKQKPVQLTTKDESVSGNSIESRNSNISITGDNNERMLLQDSKLCIEQSMQLTSKAVNSELCTILNDDTDNCDSIQLQKKKNTTDESMQSSTNDDQSCHSTVLLSCNVLVDTSKNTSLEKKDFRPSKSTSIDDVESRKSVNTIDTSSCYCGDSCKDMMLHQEESLQRCKEDEEQLLQNNTAHHLSCSYLDISCQEESTNDRKRKSKKSKGWDKSVACQSGENAEVKKPKQKLKEKAIKYYKEKIKQLKRENDQYKDKSLLLDWVSDFRNEIGQLKKSIEKLQKKTEEQESVTYRQEMDLQRLEHEVSLLKHQSQAPRSFGRQPLMEDRQDATITSSDSNECQS